MALDKATLDAYIQALYDDDGQLSSADYQLIINYILSNGEPETDPRDLIQIRRGDEADLPTLAQGELAYTLDTEELFAGGLGGNVNLTNRLGVINVKSFGAAGDGVTDDTLAIQNAIDSAEHGELYFPEGNYLVSDTLTLSGKNALEGDGQRYFKISAEGSSITSTVTTGKNVLEINQCKWLVINGLHLISADGKTPDYTTAISGCWFSSFNNCSLGSTSIGVVDSGGFNSHYYLHFDSCKLVPLSIGTGDAVERHVFQVNTFSNCYIATIDANGDYAINIFGTQGINATKFIGCDISYYNLGAIYIDEECNGNIDFDTCYFDTSPAFPVDTKGIYFNTYGGTQNSGSGNLNAFHLDAGSYIQARGHGGYIYGQRNPVSSYNLIKNGGLKAPNFTGQTNFGMSVSDIFGSEGYFSQYKKYTGTFNNANVAYYSIPLPFDGYYTLTVISRLNTGAIVTQSNSLTYNTITLSDDWTISSYTVKMNRGDEFKQSFINTVDGQAFDLDIAYVGLTYGSVGALGSIEHPDANLSGLMSNGEIWSSGTGSPEGVVTAPVGSLYTDDAGGAGTTLYVKESGTSNTGWVAK